MDTLLKGQENAAALIKNHLRTHATQLSYPHTTVSLDAGRHEDADTPARASLFPFQL